MLNGSAVANVHLDLIAKNFADQNVTLNAVDAHVYFVVSQTVIGDRVERWKNGSINAAEFYWLCRS